jgi:hypothetical protein
MISATFALVSYPQFLIVGTELENNGLEIIYSKYLVGRFRLQGQYSCWPYFFLGVSACPLRRDYMGSHSPLRQKGTKKHKEGSLFFILHFAF